MSREELIEIVNASLAEAIIHEDFELMSELRVTLIVLNRISH